MHILSLLTAPFSIFTLFIFVSELDAQTLPTTGPIKDPNGHSMLLYSMQKHSAWHIFSPRQEMPGDGYELPSLKIKRYSDCLPSKDYYSEYETLDEDDRFVFITDVIATMEAKGLFARGDVKASISLETETRISFIREIASMHRNVGLYSLNTEIAKSEDKKPKCEEYRALLEDISVNGFMDSPHILLQDLFYGEGEAYSRHTLKVSGELNAELQEDVARFLSTLGLSFKFGVDGAVENYQEKKKPLRVTNPFAFTPMTANEAEYDFITSLIANTRLGGWLDKDVYTTTEILELLQENRLIRDSVYCFPTNGELRLSEKDIKSLLEDQSPECVGDTEQRNLIVINRDEGARYIKGRALLRLFQKHMEELGIEKGMLEAG